MRLLFLLPLLSVTALNAQEVTVKTLTHVSAVADYGGKRTFKTQPLGTSRSSHNCPCGSFRAEANIAAVATARASAGARVNFFVPNKPVQADVSSDITLLGTSTGFITPAKSGTGAKPGPVAYLVTFTAPKTVQGVVSLRYTGWLKNPGAKGIIKVDLGNNNNIDFTGDLSKSTSDAREFPVDFKNGPIVFKVTMEASSPKAPSRANAQAMSQHLTLKLLKKGSCRIVTYGTSCGGASLNAGMFTLGKDSIVMTKLTNGGKNGFFARVIGGKRINTPLPGGCPLLVEPLDVVVLRADANGLFSEVFKLPAGVNFTATFQYVPFDLVGGGLKASSTNAFELTCIGF